MAYTSTSFQRGCRGGPGRPRGSADKRTRMRQAMLDATNESELEAIVRSLMWLATLRKDKHGNAVPPDMAAARLYLETMVGKPIQQIDLELFAEVEPDEDELEHLTQCALNAARHRARQKRAAEGAQQPPDPRSN